MPNNEEIHFLKNFKNIYKRFKTKFFSHVEYELGGSSNSIDGIAVH